MKHLVERLREKFSRSLSTKCFIASLVLNIIEELEDQTFLEEPQWVSEGRVHI